MNSLTSSQLADKIEGMNYKAAIAYCENELKAISHPITYIKTEKDFPEFGKKICMVDALFGSGLNKPLNGIPERLVNRINQKSTHTVSIDIPSGMMADVLNKDEYILAHRTLSIQFPKLSFFIPETGNHVGDFELVDIGIDKQFIQKIKTNNFLIEETDIKKILKPRKKFDHKGKFGHALIIAGSEGMYGASVLSSLACMRSGDGKTTLMTDKHFATQLATELPECMTFTSTQSELLKSVNEKFSAVALGPGLGSRLKNEIELKKIFSSIKIPLLLDADALNAISKNKSLLNQLPVNTILTPHVAEFDRLFGTSANGFVRHKKQIAASVKYNCIIVLKGAYTCISTQDGKSYFNPTGNAGLAKGGSGDVLTGIIASMLAQKYSPLQAAITGVYLHGLAADLATQKIHQASLLATDVIQNISKAFHYLQANDSK